MNPISLAIGVAGLGMSLFGGMGAASKAKEASGISQQMIGVEEQENDVRQNMMNLQARRAQMQTLRNAQRARAMATQAGVTQGAQFGSGLAGGLGGVSANAYTDLLGIGQQQQSGNQMFGYNRQLTGLKGQLSSIQGQESTDAGWASLGGAVMKSAPMLGPLASFGMNRIGSGMFGMANSGGMLFQ